MKNKRKIIGIDSFALNHGMCGAASYLSELVANIKAGEYEVCIFGHELDKYTYPSHTSNVRFSGINIKDTKMAESFWHKTHLNTFIRKNKFDAVLYASGFKMLPFSLIVPSFFVINDVPLPTNFVSNIYIKHIINGLKGIIAPSKYVKNELINMGIPSSKITIIANGVNTKMFYPLNLEGEDSVFVQPFSIKRPYIICVTSLANMQKGHIELIRGFDIFKQKTGSEHKLVLVGAEGDASEKVRAEVLRSHYSSSILLTGYFPHENLNKLYSASDVSIFPSKNEGSFLSVLESLASGVPTACAASGALKEVDKNSVLHFCPSSAKDIASSIERLVKTKENEERRQKLIENGLRYATSYSWQNTASQTINYIISNIDDL